MSLDIWYQTLPDGTENASETMGCMTNNNSVTSGVGRMEKAPIRDSKKQQVALETGGMREGARERCYHSTQLSQLVSHIGVLLATYL